MQKMIVLCVFINVMNISLVNSSKLRLSFANAKSKHLPNKFSRIPPSVCDTIRVLELVSR